MKLKEVTKGTNNEGMIFRKRDNDIHKFSFENFVEKVLDDRDKDESE